MAKHCDYRQLMEHLSKLISDKRSGTLYIKSDDDHAGMISLRDGHIISMFCQSQHGQPAIEQIRKMSGATCRFDPNAPGIDSGECPSTPEILRVLAPGGPESLEIPAAGEASASPAAVPKALEDLLAQLRMGLQNRIGPIATMVMDQALAESGRIEQANQVKALIDRLTREIDDKREASSFATEARSSLRKAVESAD